MSSKRLWLAGLTAGCLALASEAGSRAQEQEPTRLRIPIATLTEPSSTEVVEIESRVHTTVASAGQFDVQQMAGFGTGWGGDAQLFWGAPELTSDGPRLTVGFDLPRAGIYDLVLFHTVAPDFGRCGRDPLQTTLLPIPRTGSCEGGCGYRPGLPRAVQGFVSRDL